MTRLTLANDPKDRTFDDSMMLQQSFTADHIDARIKYQAESKLIAALKRPRNENRAYARIISSCERYSLAEKAIYAYPKAGTIIEGASIRLAEVMARSWENMDVGTQILGSSTNADGLPFTLIETYCHDLETNFTETRRYEVVHEMDLSGGKKKLLTSHRDIYEHIANRASRLRRSCILACIPFDIVQEAMAACKGTIMRGDGKITRDEKLRRMLKGFMRLGVNQEMIERFVGHDFNLINDEEMYTLISIFNLLDDKQAKIEDYFAYHDGEKDIPEPDLLQKLQKVKGKKADAEPRSD